MIKKCKICGTDFPTGDKRRKYCGLGCYWKKSSAQPNKGTFKKGMAVWNKGKKGIHLSPATEFVKGQKSPKWLPVGTIHIRTEWHNKHHPSRKWIKIAEPNKWVLFAVYNWIKKHGDIPKGLLVHHKDFDSDNDDVCNLQLVTRAQHVNIHRPMLEAFRKDIRPESSYKL